MLTIKNISASVDGKEILKGINLTIKTGEVHVIMGPNGSGKSTLSKVVAGHPDYEITDGEVIYDINFKKKNLLDMEPDIRAKEGIFMGFQYPVEIPGVSNEEFLRAAFNEICKYQGVEEMDPLDFQDFLKEKMDFLGMGEKFVNRELNVGFSGGEKKRNEILQMAVLSPKVSFLDETDSGLDVDALRVVGEGINRLKRRDNAIILITHYHRLLDYVKPDFVHVMYDGKIIKTGEESLAYEIEQNGYDSIIKESQNSN
ncbi:Fe-S cluster assembly ATPase SufC [bacterium]|nr:Fe-S cluster assembly ATPase SufC [bacterium]